MFYVTPIEENTFEPIVEHRIIYNSVFRSRSFQEAKDYALALRETTGENYIVTELVVHCWTTQTIDEAMQIF